MIDRSISSPQPAVRWLLALVLAVGLTVAAEPAHGDGFGTVVAVYETDLPYYSGSGELRGVVEGVDADSFVGQTVLDKAPRGLVALVHDGERRWFRAVHFEISSGPPIDCPDMHTGTEGSTKKPVSHNMEGSCVPAK